MKPLCALIVIVAALVAAAPAAAQVTVEGSGEPAFTNSTQNTQWVRWQNAGYDGYRLHVRWYRDSVLVTETRTSATGASGTFWANWAGVATLEEGRTYAICVQGERLLSGLWFPDGQDSCQNGVTQGKRTSTTIDRTKPTTSIAAAGGAEFAKDGSIPLSIGFQDATAGPHPTTWVCAKAGSDPCGSFTYSPQCSVPAGGGKSTTFSCGVDASQFPDGPVTVCAVAADAAVPDNPSSANQTRTADQANRSDAQCDTVVLDRQAPALTINASKTLVRTGEAVAFSSEASDASSGVDSSASRWAFGDGTQESPAGPVSHSFAQPGTYVVTFRAKDRAGNESTAEKTITVEAPASDSAPQAPNVPAGNGPVAGGGPLAGGGPGVQIGSVTVLVPKRVRLGKTKRLALGARADQAGELTLQLTRGKKVYSRLAVGLSPGQSTQRLRLPRGLKPGTYAVKIAFKPTGASWSAAGIAKIVLRK